MIHEVDHALRLLIEREALAGTDVEVVFDAPTKDWAARRTVPTVDVYLYDIREDMRRRERGMINTYDDTGTKVASRHLPPRHFKLSYLVTAWTQRPEDEHRLLATLLSCFLQYEALPPDLVTGPLADVGLPVPLSIALPPPEDRSFADVWSALGGELKPSLDIVVSAPTQTGVVYPAAPAITGPATISLGGLGAWPPRETRQGRAGTRHGASGTDGAALPTNGVGAASGDAGTGPDGEDGSGPAGADRTRGRRGKGGQGRGAKGAGAAGSDPSGGDDGTGDDPDAHGGGTVGSTPKRGMDWNELAGRASPAPPLSAEGAPPRRRGAAGGTGIQRKDKNAKSPDGPDERGTSR